jgi:hypothetical protein
MIAVENTAAVEEHGDCRRECRYTYKTSQEKKSPNYNTSQALKRSEQKMSQIQNEIQVKTYQKKPAQ